MIFSVEDVIGSHPSFLIALVVAVATLAPTDDAIFCFALGVLLVRERPYERGAKSNVRTFVRK